MNRLQQKKTKGLIAAFFLILMAIFVILHLESLGNWIGMMSHIFRPVLIGLILAYLCNPLFRLFERKWFVNVSPSKLRRVIALLFTYAIVFLIFFTLIMLIVPQLVSSILDFFNSDETYLYDALQNINGILAWINQNFSVSVPFLEYEEIKESISNLLKGLDIQKFIDALLTYSNITAFIEMLGNVIFLITDILFGLFISCYLLYSKEKRYAQIMRLRRACFSDSVNKRITSICTVADRSFGGFLRGKLLDSTMVGVLVYIIITIMQVPYSVLIAVIIGITDIVPVIGPFVGVIPTAIIILLTDPIKVIPFLLCILIVQQIDGNIIAPKILGENTGVSSLCVMIAITLMGSIWGLAGMVLGVPLFATILELTDRYLEARLRKKGLPAKTDNYYGTQTESTQSTHKNTAKARQKSSGIAAVTEGGQGALTAKEREALKTYQWIRQHGITAKTSEEELISLLTNSAEQES